MKSLNISKNTYLNNLKNLNYLLENTVNSLRTLALEGNELTKEKVATLDMSKLSPQFEEINLENNPKLDSISFLIPFFEANKTSKIKTIKLSSVNFEIAQVLAQYRP